MNILLTLGFIIAFGSVFGGFLLEKVLSLLFGRCPLSASFLAVR